MSSKTPHTLYICYFGLREPLVQTQVLPYLREINKLENIKISILTFEPEFKEKWTPEEIKTERKKLAQEGITWHCLPYHKRPSVPATAFDIYNGARFVRQLIKKEQINILHARVQVPALMGALAKKLSGGEVKLIFDIRGFFPEEYTDAGVWKENGMLYRTAKRNEGWLMKESDAFVVLTEKARGLLFPESFETGEDAERRPVEVIPCCIDPKRFQSAETIDREAIRQELNLSGKKVFVYVGSFGGWYLTDEMIRFFVQAHRQIPDAFTMILTQRDIEKVEKKLIEAGLNKKDFLVRSVSPAEVPKYLKSADVALSFIKACYSKQASSPTKIAEYLASGLPIVSNSGVGDLDALIEGEKVGVIIRDFNEEDYSRALTEINRLFDDGDIRRHCRETADKIFDLEKVAGTKYRLLYKKLINRL